MDPAVLVVAQGVLVRLAVAVLMVSIGLRVPLAKVRVSLRQRSAVAATLVVALLCVPVIGWSTVWAFGLAPPIAFGILLTVSSPGGSMALKLVDLADGALDLGLGLYFLLAVIAPFALPVTAFVLIGFDASAMTGEVAGILLTLVTIQLVPLLIGIAIARVRPAIARQLGIGATRATTVLLAALIGVGILVNRDHIVAVGPSGVAAIIVIDLVTVVIGLLLGRRDPRTGRTVAFLAAQRSASLALLVTVLLGDAQATGVVLAYGIVLLIINPISARIVAMAQPLRSSSVRQPSTTG
jgi:predicted Na+-dependent transporter